MIPLLFALIASLSAADFAPIPAGEQTVLDSASGFQVKVTTGAYVLGRTEVTQSEYLKLTGKNPSRFQGPGRPVENVTWLDAITYANRRSESERFTPCYDLATTRRRPHCTGYRLPTSAEWNFAFSDSKTGAFRNSGYQDAATLLSAEAAGTRPVAQDSPNKFGLHDMAGNVWEWCEDWYSPAPPLDSIRDPQGPATGLSRVIRGGSFLTGGTQWNKGLLSGMDPARRSPFTGFRLARTVSPAPKAAPPTAAWLAQFQHAAPPVPAVTANARQTWRNILGTPNQPTTPPTAKRLRLFTHPAWNSELLELSTGTRILLTWPLRKPPGRLPVIIVPYYDVDTPAGADLGGRRFTEGGARAFALLAAQRGFLAVSVQWFGEALGEGYDEAVLQHTRQFPNVTPMGKWIWDLQRVIDYVQTRPGADTNRIGIIGHSLGGKMALYAAAFEPRIKAIVSSEPGISLNFSNYADFWYLGKAIEKLPPGADHHDLLTLIAPRPFLLIAGESADGAKSWPFLAAAQPSYPQKHHIGMFNHRAGHSPTEESVQLAMEWLERFLL